jgi:peptide/nickel transport system permease protein
MLIRYLYWAKGIITKGDFGYSFEYGVPVSKVIWTRLGNTLIVALGAHMLAVCVGVLIGIFSATRQYGLADTIFTVIAFLGLSTPPFFLALLAMYYLAIQMGVDVGGFFSPEYVFAKWSWARFADFLKHISIPIIIVGLPGITRNMRVMRGNLLDILGQMYIRTARAKGLSERVVIYKHAVRNAIQPIIMFLGMAMPFLIQGSIVVSVVLSLPTTGPMLYNAILSEDMYLAGSFLLLLSTVLVVGNFMADILLAWVDPRIRYD